jgi:hypothetical protein
VSIATAQRILVIGKAINFLREECDDRDEWHRWQWDYENARAKERMDTEREKKGYEKDGVRERNDREEKDKDGVKNKEKEKEKEKPVIDGIDFEGRANEEVYSPSSSTSQAAGAFDRRISNSFTLINQKLCRFVLTKTSFLYDVVNLKVYITN